MKRFPAVIVLVLLLAGSARGQVSPWVGSWIWNASPTEDLYFRKDVAVKNGLSGAKMAITADNVYDLYVNGVRIGSDDDWTTVEVYDITRHLRTGRNVIAVKARDPDATIGAFLAEVAFTYTDRSVQVFGTDATWRMAHAEQPGWTSISFDDSSWMKPKVLGKPPMGPWSGLDHPDLYPKPHLRTLSVRWPKDVEPGDSFPVSCVIQPERPIPVDSPVGVRLLLENEPVCEQWTSPPTPMSLWKPGNPVEIRIKSFRLPTYVPTGRMRVQVVTAATQNVGGSDITIGRPQPVKPVPTVEVATFSVSRESGPKRSITAAVRTQGLPPGGRMNLALFRNKEMWFISDIKPSGETRIDLPKDLPGGTYEAALLSHESLARGKTTVRIKLPGSESTALKPLGYGTFLDTSGIPHDWHINRAGTLIWDGEPYIPAGGMYISSFFMGFRLNDADRNERNLEDDIKRLTMLKSAGVTDIYMNPCVGWESKPVWVWNRFCKLCDDLGIRYGLQVTNELGRLDVYDVDPGRYTTSVKAGEKAVVDIPNTLLTEFTAGDEVLYAAFDTATGKLVDAGKASVVAGKQGIRAEARPRSENGRDLTVEFVPECTHYGGPHDYWNGVNAKYTSLLHSFFSRLKPGPGFRLWIDPLDNEQSFTVIGDRILPRSAAFRETFARRLRAKYGTPERLLAAWALSDPAGKLDFAACARLVPIGKASPDSAEGYLLDDQTGQSYRYDAKESSMWKDMLYIRDNSVADFNNMVAELIKSHHDAPVVLKHEGSDLFRNRRTYGGFDGLGAEAYGTDSKHLMDCSAAVHNQSKRCGRTMWELTTETGLAGTCVGYPDPSRMVSDYTSMVQMGGKGTYCFLFDRPTGDPNADWYGFNLYEDARQLRWLGVYARVLQEAPGLPDYAPGETETLTEFQRRVLRLETLDLGPALQGVRFGRSTCIWNMSDQDRFIGVDVPQTETDASIRCSDGSIDSVLHQATTLLFLPANASAPVVVEGLEKPALCGVDKMNYAAALREWCKARKRFDGTGLTVPDRPSSDDWHVVLQEAQALNEKAGDAFATRASHVTVDGDLSEWQGCRPLYLKAVTTIDSSIYGGAKFYVQYDSDHLYIAGAVTDKTVSNTERLGRLWNGDAVEVFIDLHPNANPGSPDYTDDCLQFLFTPTSADGTPGMEAIGPAIPGDSVPGNTTLKVKRTDDGWSFEAAIGIKDIKDYAIRSGGQIGFNIQLDNSDGGERVWSRLWRGQDDCFRNRLRFGRLTFAK